MFYDRRIRYLDYMENGEKIRSVGFLKIEVMGELCSIRLQVTGLSNTDNCIRDVWIRGKQTEGLLGVIQMKSGRGSLTVKQLPAESICEGISYDDLSTVRISLGKTRELICRWKEEEGQRGVQQEETPREELPQEEPPQEEQTSEESVQEEAAQEETRQEESLQEEEDSPETEPLLKTEACGEASDRPQLPPIPSAVREDKWKQLSAIYPHIAPFHDERDYLSIGPEDFVVLSRQDYRLVTNSFLLHGYYNYGHMILARTVKKGEEKFYLGVPGNFYERERQVAILFGFESFECRKEPVQMGDYGYFMIRVEL